MTVPATPEVILPAAADLLRRGGARLAAAGIAEPRREARLFLAHAMGVGLEVLLATPSRVVTSEVVTAYEEMIEQRTRYRPYAHIVGTREFWSLSFLVEGSTLIPRPDSETLIEAALAVFPRRETVRRVLDLGTGTGCLLLAALAEFPHASGVGVDLDEEACRLAQRNARRLGFSRRAAVVCSDWASALKGEFDLILCNPPYVPTVEIEALDPEVRDFEPRRALDGGADGLGSYRRVVPAIAGLLSCGGSAIIEIGSAEAASAVAEMGAAAGLAVLFAAEDLAGRPRCLAFRAREGCRGE